MESPAQKAEHHREALRELLARGGAALTLAVISYANRDDNGNRTPWSVLSPELIAAAEQVGNAVAASSEEALALAIQSAVSPPRTALPSWLSPLIDEPHCLSFIGRQTASLDLTSALGPKRSAPSVRERGLAVAALALCRLQDTLLTLANRLTDPPEGHLLSRMGHLANVTAAPGEPSKVRGMLRVLLKGRDSWDV